MKLEWDTLSITIADELKEALLPLLESEDDIVELNLENINKIDLASIQLLLSLKKSLQSKNSTLKLTNCTNSVIAAFELCGCLEILRCFDE